MLEVYSKNVSVDEDAIIPLNSVVIDKGISTVLQGSSTIQLNKCGIYQVNVSASVTPTAETGGIVSIQLQKDNALQPQAIASASLTDIGSLSFSTLIQVTHNNSNCICATSTNINIVNVGVAANFDTIDVSVIRI